MEKVYKYCEIATSEHSYRVCSDTVGKITAPK